LICPGDAANDLLSGLEMVAGCSDRGLILRFYETGERRTDMNGELLRAGEAMDADLIERPGKPLGHTGKTLPLSFEPYKIKTIRVVRKDR
jgi:hypothetical protein